MDNELSTALASDENERTDSTGCISKQYEEDRAKLAVEFDSVREAFLELLDENKRLSGLEYFTGSDDYGDLREKYFSVREDLKKQKDKIQRLRKEHKERKRNYKDMKRKRKRDAILNDQVRAENRFVWQKAKRLDKECEGLKAPLAEFKEAIDKNNLEGGKGFRFWIVKVGRGERYEMVHWQVVITKINQEGRHDMNTSAFRGDTFQGPFLSVEEIRGNVLPGNSVFAGEDLIASCPPEIEDSEELNGSQEDGQEEDGQENNEKENNE